MSDMEEDMQINDLAVSVHTPEDYSGTVIMINGFGGTKDKEHRINRATFFAENGFRVVRYDYRGLGESGPGKKSLTVDFNDLISIIDHFRCEVGLFGESWGGILALLGAARNKQVKAIVGRVPVVDVEHFSKKGRVLELPYLADNFLEDLLSYNTYEEVKKRQVPTLLFVGSKDPACPPEFTKKLYEILNEPKKLVEFPAGHFFSEGEFYEKTSQESLEWFKKYL